MGGLTGCSRRIGTTLEKAITCGVVMKDDFVERAKGIAIEAIAQHKEEK